MSSAVQQIKDRLGIVEVVSSYLKLDKAGINYKARCPFHQEKTASFFVSPARGSFYCFGCNKGGDIVSFVEEIEGLDFMGALKVLAERAGVTLERLPSSADPEREQVLAALEAARQFYCGRLTVAPAVGEYLRHRGLNDETIAAWGLGFAPAEWQGVLLSLRQAGFSDEVIGKAGLALQSQTAAAAGRWYDRFRSRIMFPLFDSSGRVIGFSGRVFPPEASAEAGGKYINSPQTAVYDKGRFLYGLDRAKVAIRRADQVVLVEGQFDLLLSHQAGVTNAVAVSGTALTEHHLATLGRLAKNVVMAFDGDKAGIAAASRGVGLALAAGLEVKIARLPLGVDPADLIRAEPGEWPRRVAGALNVIDFLLAVIGERGLDDRGLAHAIKAEVYPYVSQLRERIDQAHFISRIAELTGLDESVIRADIADLLNRPALGPAPAKPLSLPAKSRRGLIEERLAGLEALAAAGTDESGEMAELRHERERELWREERAELMRELARVQRSGDEPAIRSCLERIQAISQKINNRANN